MSSTCSSFFIGLFLQPKEVVIFCICDGFAIQVLVMTYSLYYFWQSCLLRWAPSLIKSWELTVVQNSLLILRASWLQDCASCPYSHTGPIVSLLRLKGELRELRGMEDWNTVSLQNLKAQVACSFPVALREEEELWFNGPYQNPNSNSSLAWKRLHLG